MQRFLEEMVRMPEVWVVNNWEAIQWMQKPTPVNMLSQFEPWKCKAQVHHFWNYCTLFKDRADLNLFAIKDSTGGQGLQHCSSLQIAIARFARRSLSSHMHRMPPSLPLDQERIRFGYLRMSPWINDTGIESRKKRNKARQVPWHPRPMQTCF